MIPATAAAEIRGRAAGRVRDEAVAAAIEHYLDGAVVRVGLLPGLMTAVAAALEELEEQQAE
jgi:hypothetical protein